MNKDKIQSIIIVLERTLSNDVNPKIADEIVKMAIATLKEERDKAI